MPTMTSPKPRGAPERTKLPLRPLRDEVAEVLGSFQDLLGSFRAERARATTDLARRLRNATADRQREVREMLARFRTAFLAGLQREGETRRFRYGRGSRSLRAPEAPPRREAPKHTARPEAPPAPAGKPAGSGPPPGAPPTSSASAAFKTS